MTHGDDPSSVGNPFGFTAPVADPKPEPKLADPRSDTLKRAFDEAGKMPDGYARKEMK